MVNDGEKGYRRRRRNIFFHATSASLPEVQIFHTTSASLPDVQIFYTTSASLRRTENRFSGINYAGTTSPCSTYRTLPPRASAGNPFKKKLCRDHESGATKFFTGKTRRKITLFFVMKKDSLWFLRVKIELHTKSGPG